ncbi:MAG: metallophosphoesterase family protein [Actinobacteria bacterium]|nr:metallophosphoesterase family protein [Actinomycetota bacterium]
MRIGIVADTHLRGGRTLPDVCAGILRGTDLVIHAGDISSLAALRAIEALGPPVVAVHGNVDDADICALLPERRIVCTSGVRIGVIHDSGSAAGRLERLRLLFAATDAVVFGHSHIPLHEQATGGFQIFNPGSPTQRRGQPQHTLGIARVDRGRIHFELVGLEGGHTSSSSRRRGPRSGP